MHQFIQRNLQKSKLNQKLETQTGGTRDKKSQSVLDKERLTGYRSLENKRGDNEAQKSWHIIGVGDGFVIRKKSANNHICDDDIVGSDKKIR